MEEEWRPVAGYEGRYEVSSLGRLRSYVVGDQVKPLTVQTDKRGYRFILLRQRSASPKGCWVHRLVAQAFVPNPLGLAEVNHIDGNKANNDFRNLEWVTRGENIHHAYATGLRINKHQFGTASHFAKLSNEQVGEIRLRYRQGLVGSLAKQYGVSPSAIYRIVRHKSWSHI